METYVMSDHTGLPTTMIIRQEKELHYHTLFGCIDGDKNQYYKFGYDGGCASYDNTYVLSMLRKYFPTKYHTLLYTQPCSYANTEDGDFIFEKKDKVVFAFALQGGGFKHMPYHGKRVYQLLSGE